MPPDFLDALDPRQRVAATSQPLPRRQLTGGVMAVMIALRAFIFVSVPIVVYAFVHALLTPQ